MVGKTVRILMVTAISIWIVARAEGNEGASNAYAVVIGSNRPGQGQTALRYARTDAVRFKTVLTELCGYPSNRIDMLRDPSPQQVLHAIERISAKIRRHADMGEKSAFVFYYSGHARAHALNIGWDELPLAALRALVEKVPANFKLVVLDACQTGAISNVKGVSPAASFSYNSVNGLNQEGLAVLAASAASELAQESEELEGSFFTHHLVAALRGAADTNGDGRVTLEEAYRYTYNRTLVDTSKTAVGKQHATLETKLSGKGETVLSRPDIHRTTLVLPRDIEGEMLVVRKRDAQVMADLHKTRSGRMTLAMPADKYTILIRRLNQAYECPVRLERGTGRTLRDEDCVSVPLRKLRQKGEKHRREEHLFFEAGLGGLVPRNDSYTRRLEAFELFADKSRKMRLHVAVSVQVNLLRYLKVGIAYSLLDDSRFESELETFSWRAHRLSATVRGLWPVANDWLVLYLQIGAGLAMAGTDYERNSEAVPLADTRRKEVSYHERFLGYNLAGGAGLQLTPWQHVGFLWQLDYIFAPVIENLMSDTHDAGGLAIIHGVTAGF